ncbi:delta(14)-sterol reductase TM7SF2-like isoform X2 [Lycorma delicatula]|uniref:delta(14)-sterol reductase TM7SF2-like isoform X2 n=1 Tax=Lycorma delicatula TaxID=130591 RepID=UPI003F5195AF
MNELRNSRERSRTIEEVRISQTRTLLSSGNINYEVETSSGGVVRRSSRLRSASKELDGIKKEIEKKVEKLIKSNHVLSSSDYGSKSAPQEFCGWPGAFFLIYFVPIFVVALQLSCVKEKCKPFDFTVSTNWKYYLDPFATAWFTGFVTWQFLLSILPLNKKINPLPYTNESLQYRCSGIVNALLSLSVIGVLQYFRYPVTFVITKTVPLLISSLLFGFLLSLVLFIKGGRPGVIQNSYGNTGNKVYDFWIGREVNPRFGILDVKQTLTRIAVVGALIYDAVIILKAVENKEFPNYPPTILVLTGLQIFTFLDFLFYEEIFLTSFFIQYEGTGYMLVIGSFVWPFFVTVIPKILLMHSIELNVYLLAALTIFYFLAYFVYRLSTNQKGNFRKSSLSPTFANFESIPTVSGKKLLSGGWWGFVRQPNYLGVILMYWILAVSVRVSHWVPYAVALAATTVLIHRAIRKNARYKTIYTSSWDRYTQKVKYYIIPKIF